MEHYSHHCSALFLVSCSFGIFLFLLVRFTLPALVHLFPRLFLFFSTCCLSLLLLLLLDRSYIDVPLFIFFLFCSFIFFLFVSVRFISFVVGFSSPLAFSSFFPNFLLLSLSLPPLLPAVTLCSLIPSIFTNTGSAARGRAHRQEAGVEEQKEM